MGNQVEECARGLFPNGFLVERRSAGAQELTKKLISEKTPVIFQAVFSTDKFLAATDVLSFNEKANAYDLYEIKMSSTEEEDEDGKVKVNRKKEEQFEYDLAFQTNVLELCGLKINKKYLVRLNKNYVKYGDFDFDKLFIKEDKTEKIDILKSVALSEMGSSYDYLSQMDQPDGACPCYYKGRSAHCTTFNFLNPDVPEYGVHDLNRIGSSKKYLAELLNRPTPILKIDDVPESEIPKPSKGKDGSPGKPRKLNQVKAYKTKKEIINLDAIKTELDSLKFPLYFLDYETYPTALPIFNGYHPYQHIVFQYSLHILESKDAKLEHKECLITDGDPAERLVTRLREDIGNIGTVISWSKKFENSRNKELANLIPSQAEFLNNLINRTYDLMDIVENQYYVHHGFKGSSSIKKVQPVLAPNFSYKDLPIKSGTDAIEAYRQILEKEIVGEELKHKLKEMLKYCEYDTEVMYEIWKFFNNLVEVAK